MQDLSYTFLNKHLDLKCCDLELTAYSFTNAYSIDPACSSIEESEHLVLLKASGLLTDGGQTKVQGSAEVRVQEQNGAFTVSSRFTVKDCLEEFRSVKLTVRGFPCGKILGLNDARPRMIPEEGLILNYPEGWRDLGTPLTVLTQSEGNVLYFRSLDDTVRRKIFAFNRRGDSLIAELVFEELAEKMGSTIQSPEWEFSFAASAEEIYARHEDHVTKAYALPTWEDRKDVPKWAREISLIAAIHGQHWTGYIFNDYAGMLENIKRLSDKIEPKRILAYLPGWEGRYYWKYGAYGPDERMGGAEGLHRLAEESRKIGVHLCPMYGINVAGIHVDGFMEWGDVSEARSASGNIRRGSVDWDASRHYDHGSGRTLNPGAPKWQNRLVRQIVALSKEYGFDAAFLDIAAYWENDPNHAVYDGVVKLAARLHCELDDFLIAGEAWYDALGAAIPLLQCGHTDGRLNWHDEAYPPRIENHVREFGHLCLGDPAEKSTGVHELGRNPIWRCPLRKSVIPTLTITDGTLLKAEKEVDLVISDAKEYADRFLK